MFVSSNHQSMESSLFEEVSSCAAASYSTAANHLPTLKIPSTQILGSRPNPDQRSIIFSHHSTIDDPRNLTIVMDKMLSRKSDDDSSCCSSPDSNTHYTEAKQSFTSVEEISLYIRSTTDHMTSHEDEDDDFRCHLHSSSNLRSTNTSNPRSRNSSSDITYMSNNSTSRTDKPHKAANNSDIRWEAIRIIRAHYGGVSLNLNHFRVLTKVGGGDIGKVYLSELAGTGTYFAIKVMDKADLEGRKKVIRARTEKEILKCLDHPFLPTLYTSFETERLECLVMEFCPGGDLHSVQQRRVKKCFTEDAARFYVAEVLLALEYLHMMGIVYRDLKPENVLVREDGHIMLSDFDLSLRSCAVSPIIITSSSSNTHHHHKPHKSCIDPPCVLIHHPINCFSPTNKFKHKKNNPTKSQQQLVAEPTSARSMSFVGTHEYLAPEIIKGEGHGSAVDWWTLGIFLYELLIGRTPFKGNDNRTTLFNVVSKPLRFPDTTAISFAARDLIRGLLVKDPNHRLGYKRGAAEIKQHPFFHCVKWALVRCQTPPIMPRPFVYTPPTPAANANLVMLKPVGHYYQIDLF